MADKFTQTVTPQAQGGAGQLVDISQEQQVSNVWESALGLQKAAIGAVEQITDEKIKELELSGSMKALEVNAQRQNMDPEEADELYSKEQEDYMNGTSDMSEAEAKAYFQNTLEQATQFKNKATEIRTDRNVMVEVSLLSNKISEDDFNALDNFSNLSSRYGVTKQKIRDAFIISKHEKDLNRINSIKTREDRDRIISIIEEENKKLNIPELYGTQSKGRFGEMIKSNKLIMKNALSAVDSRIKAEDYSTIAGYKKDYLRPMDKTLEDAINNTSSNVDAAQTVKKEYLKNHKNALEVEKIKNRDTQIPANEEDAYILQNNKNAASANEDLISDNFEVNFDNGDIESSIDMIISNPGSEKYVGDRFLEKVKNSNDPEYIKKALSYIDEMEKHPRGIQAANDIIPLKERMNLGLITMFAETKFSNSKNPLLDAREYVDQQYSSKQYAFEIDREDRDLINDMNKIYLKFGKRGNEVKAVIEHMYKIGGPTVYSNAKKTVNKWFSNNIGNITKKSAADSDLAVNITYDKSLVSQAGYDNDNEFYEAVKNKYSKDVVDTSFAGNIVQLGDKFYVEDQDGAYGKIYNISDIKKGSVVNIESKKNIKEDDSIFAVNNITNPFVNTSHERAYEIWNTIGSKLNDMLDYPFEYESVASNEPDNIIPNKELTMEEGIALLDKYADNLPTDLSDPDSIKNFEPQDQYKILGSLDQNKYLKEQIKRQTSLISESIKKESKDVKQNLLQSISIKEGGYSTDRNDKGNYYKNEFVGTNHGISAPILAEYLGRTPTVNDMKNLSKDDAQKILWNRYYEKKGLENLPKDVQEIVFHGIVTGEGHAVKVMQELIGVKADGSVGPNTIKAMKKANFTKEEFKDALLKKYQTFPDWKTQGKGWTNRFEDLAK